MMHTCNSKKVTIFQRAATFSRIAFGDEAIEIRWSHVEDFSQTDLSQLEVVLAPAELERVHAARTEPVRKARLLARALLKAELARRTGIAAANLQLQLSPYGKPCLSSTSNSPLRFNQACSHGWIVHAFSNRFEIGVDLEHVNPDYLTSELVQDMLTKDEQAILAALPEVKRANRFFQFWTAKESVLKGTGVGFSGLNDLTVENCDAFSYLGQSWKTSALTAPAGFVATIAWPDM